MQPVRLTAKMARMAMAEPDLSPGNGSSSGGTLAEIGFR